MAIHDGPLNQGPWGDPYEATSHIHIPDTPAELTEDAAGTTLAPYDPDAALKIKMISRGVTVARHTHRHAAWYLLVLAVVLFVVGMVMVLPLPITFLILGGVCVVGAIVVAFAKHW